MIDSYNQIGWVRNQPTYGLKAMVKALSMMEILNTEEENQRLALAKLEIKRRCANLKSGTAKQLTRVPVRKVSTIGCILFLMPYSRNVNKFSLKIMRNLTIEEYKELLLEDELKIGYDVEEDFLPEEIEDESYIDGLLTSGFHAINDSEMFGEEIVGYSLY